MTAAGKTIFDLTGPQQDAVRPDAHVWLRASAGTGKTQVLSARVFRLLLTPGVRPENILCLTFTKAGATEMAERIDRKLAAWVRMPDERLAMELKAIGAGFDAESRGTARQLFARMLDAPGGGLRIVTIHAFCQSLLSAFPMEAGMLPGFAALDEREQQGLRSRTLSDLVVDAEKAGDATVGDAIAELSAALGEEGAEKFLHSCAAAGAVLEDVSPNQEGQRRFARTIVGSAVEGELTNWLAGHCTDDGVDCASLRELAEMLRLWGKRNSTDDAAAIEKWLAAAPDDRASLFHTLHATWTKKDGTLRSAIGHVPADPQYQHVSARLHTWATPLIEQIVLSNWADRYASALGVGVRFASAYSTAKRLRGVADFDDLIRHAARLLGDPMAGDWIRYKLDSHIDHVLIDEAQDTNSDQWAILRSLTADYFAGLGARGERLRTLFAVGDYKQAIFGFQGTSPRHYETARVDFDDRARGAAMVLEDVALSHSFRSTRPILTFVDKVIEIAGSGGFGTDTAIPPHLVTRGEGGEVLLLPVSADRGEEDDADGEESWLPDAKRKLASQIAEQVQDWLADAECKMIDGRRMAPGDIMILVQSRGELAGLLVARLHAAGVPVAGVDRLQLRVPLAVQDCMAAVRFVVQPLDDLNLAALLVSPLLGWTQDDLMQRALRPPGIGLWRWLRREHRDVDGMDMLRTLLRAADFNTPYRFIEDLLIGPFDGRRRLAERLGSEAFDPLDELLNFALQFTASQGGGLQEFISWFDNSQIDVKRDQVGHGNEVRIMTVHGAKGLQAPVVILADTTRNPMGGGARAKYVEVPKGRLPLLPIAKPERVGGLGALAEVAELAELEEHKRLLYVAMTRAEQRLIIAGSLDARGTAPDARSWYPLLEDAMIALGADEIVDDRWGRCLGIRGKPPSRAKQIEDVPPPAPIAPEPLWLRAPAPAEARPPRPLAPSQAETDDTAQVPASPALRAAAACGKLIHSLFERLPDLPPADRRGRALRWLAQNAPDAGAGVHHGIVDAVLSVLDAPEWQALFGPESLAEVPIAAVVGGTVVTGRADRLLITADRIDVIDFKTGRAVPHDAASVPVPYLRQMAWYVAALETLFPGRLVRAGILYSHAPRLIQLEPADIAAYRPD